MERQLLKLGGKKVRGMKGFNRWAPVIGGAYLCVVVGLRVAGQEDAAKALETVGGLVGVTRDPAVSYPELMGAATLGWGVCRKLIAAVKKAKDADNSVSIPIR